MMTIQRTSGEDSDGGFVTLGVEGPHAQIQVRADHADLLWALLSLCWWQAKRTT